VSADLLESLEIVTDLAVQHVGQSLAVLAVLDVFLSVEKPVGNLVLARVRHHRYHLLHLITSISTTRLSVTSLTHRANSLVLHTSENFWTVFSFCAARNPPVYSYLSSV